jgi:hypothetical protein
MSIFKQIQKNILYSKEYLKKLEKKSLYLKIRCEESGYVNIFSNNFFHFLSIEEIFHDNNSVINYHDKNKILVLNENENTPYLHKHVYGVYKYNMILKTLEKINTFTNNRIFGSEFSKDGTLFVYYTNSHLVYIYDVLNQKEIDKINCIYVLNHYCKKKLKISQDNSIIIIFISNKFIIYDVKTKISMVYDTTNITGSKIGDIFIKNKDHLIIGFLNGLLIELKEGKHIIIKHDKNYEFDKGLFSPCGNIFVITYSNGGSHNEQLKIISIYNDIIENFYFKTANLCFSPDSRYLISTYNDNLLLYDISYIGNKNKIMFDFSRGLEIKDTTLNNFSKHYLYDRNVLNLIFDFIPYFQE